MKQLKHSLWFKKYLHGMMLVSHHQVVFKLGRHFVSWITFKAWKLFSDHTLKLHVTSNNLFWQILFLIDLTVCTLLEIDIFVYWITLKFLTKYSQAFLLE